MADLLSPEAITEALAELSGWSGDQQALTRSFTYRTFPEGILSVAAVAAAAERLDHHPDIDIRWCTVTYTVSTHSAGGVTDLDLALCAAIDDLADPS